MASRGMVRPRTCRNRAAVCMHGTVTLRTFGDKPARVATGDAARYDSLMEQHSPQRDTSSTPAKSLAADARLVVAGTPATLSGLWPIADISRLVCHARRVLMLRAAVPARCRIPAGFDLFQLRRDRDAGSRDVLHDVLSRLAHRSRPAHRAEPVRHRISDVVFPIRPRLLDRFRRALGSVAECGRSKERRASCTKRGESSGGG